MTIKILSGVYTANYNLRAPITTLSIASTGHLNGGLTAAGTAAYTIVNRGAVAGSGVSLAGTGVVNNYATISGTQYGIVLKGVGAVTNGATGQATALISGYNGVKLAGGSKLTNNGTIRADSQAGGGVGVSLSGDSTLTNQAGALIVGSFGVLARAGDTVTNFGTIQGKGVAALELNGAGSRLNAEAGSAITGMIISVGGTIDAVSGVISLGGVDTSSTIEGAGTLSLGSGTSFFNAGASLLVTKIAVSGVNTAVEVETSLVDARIWNQTDATLLVDSGDQTTFRGTGSSFTGTLTGAGTINFIVGSDTFSNLTLSATKMLISRSTVTMSGSIGIAGTLTVTTPNLIVAAAGASLSGGGTILLSNTATNSLHGDSATATLTNDDIIRGAGALGGGVMTLVNAASGTIEGSGSVGLTIDTGAKTIANAGMIEAMTGGGVVISSAVANTGTLSSSNGTLTVNGAVTGAGIVEVLGGVAHFTSTIGENVTFGATGLLVLVHGQTYGGTISGFSHTGTTSLDLADIAFGGSTTATYSGTATSGILSVTDGSHTAKIHFSGNYLSAKWILSAASGGGTHIVDPTPRRTSAAPLVIAMASFGASHAGSAPPALPAWMAAAPILAGPRHLA